MLIDNWKRTLTHGYAAWGIYFTIAANLAFEALPFINDWIPRWSTVAILAGVLIARVTKQETVSGGDNE